jgi:hypothetical protein
LNDVTQNREARGVSERSELVGVGFEALRCHIYTSRFIDTWSQAGRAVSVGATFPKKKRTKSTQR